MRLFSWFWRKRKTCSVVSEVSSGYQPPSRRTVRHHLKRLNVKCFNSLIDELRAVESLAVTCDFGSDKKMRSYLCLTDHYIIGNRLKSTALAFNVCDERHTSENIAKAILSSNWNGSKLMKKQAPLLATVLVIWRKLPIISSDAEYSASLISFIWLFVMAFACGRKRPFTRKQPRK